MAEYPQQTCNPYLAQFQATNRQPFNTDYLVQNTVPKPHVEFNKPNQLNQYNSLGLSHTNEPPNLSMSPLNKMKKVNFVDEFERNHQENNGNASCTKVKGILKNGDKMDCECAETSGVPKEIQNSQLEAITSQQPPQPTTGMDSNAVEDVLKKHTAELRSSNLDRPACYLPQPEDNLLVQQSNEMGPIGPWATGKADWGPLAGLTGTRPVVDKYSITRYSEGEWRKHNKELIDNTLSEKHHANLVEWNGHQCLEQTQYEVDKNQEDNTKRLNQRELEIMRWKCELERAISAAAEEISLMEEQRRRLKQAASVLQMPESIASECLDRRTGRLDSELVRDKVEDELIKEMSLCAEIREIFSRTLKDVEKQLLEDKTAKQRLEFDWSDKKYAHELDALCSSLTTRSTTLLFRPGSVVFPDKQSTPEFWEHFTKESLLDGEATRQRSAALRGTLDAILNNAARDLRTQCDKIEMALDKRVTCTEEVTRKLEMELKQVLMQLAEVENLINSLRAAIRRLDMPMKKAQTRLDIRLLRPRVENCRDAPSFGLVDEVKSISENVAALQAQLGQAQKSQKQMINIRNNLEREIMLKKKTLEIDKDRTKRIRSYYPSTTALSGL